MELTDSLKYQLALTLIPGVGSVLAKSLVSYCGTVEAVFKEKKERLGKIPGIGPKTAASIAAHKDMKRAEKEVLFIEKNKITPLFYLDKAYPSRLKQCNDSPVLLFLKGNADLNHPRIVAVVGTRQATPYGKEACEKLIEDLGKEQVFILSGLAYGIDICAHRAALKHRLPTVGVLAHGLDTLYPQVHRNTAVKMLAHGGLVTEYLSQTNPDKDNFPKRNRIVAGLADATVVVEAAKSGGALITAEIANDYNRDVFALPGRAGDTYSEGCNRLIKTNKAHLLESAADLLYIMGWEQKVSKKNTPQQRTLFPELTEEEQCLVSLLAIHEKLDVDTLCIESNMPPGKAASVLLKLEFDGVLKSLPGKIYQLLG